MERVTRLELATSSLARIPVLRAGEQAAGVVFSQR